MITDERETKRKERIATGIMGVVMLLIVGVLLFAYWPAQSDCVTVEALNQERLGNQEAMKAAVLWYQAQLTTQRVAAERELADALAARIPWNTKGNGPLDLPPLTPEQIKARLIAYAEPQLTEETLVESKLIPISKHLMQAFGSQTMQMMRVGRP